MPLRSLTYADNGRRTASSGSLSNNIRDLSYISLSGLGVKRGSGGGNGGPGERSSGLGLFIFKPVPLLVVDGSPQTDRGGC